MSRSRWGRRFVTLVSSCVLLVGAGSGGCDASGDGSGTVGGSLSSAGEDASKANSEGAGADVSPWYVDAAPAGPEGCERFQVVGGLTCGSQDIEGYEGSFYVARTTFAADDTPILHVIGVYEGEPGEAEVAVGAAVPIVLDVGPSARPMELVLASYDPVNWTLNLAEGTQLDRIWLFGYYEQTVSGVDGVPIEGLAEDGGPFRGQAYEWPWSSGGSDTPGFLLDVEEQTGLPVSSFHGRYKADAAHIGHVCLPDCDAAVACADRVCGAAEGCGYDCGWCREGYACREGQCEPCTPSCEGQDCGDDGCGGSCGTCGNSFRCDEDSGACLWVDPFEACDHVRRTNEHYCFSVGTQEHALFGLETGERCELPMPGVAFPFSGPQVHSIAVDGEFLYVCGGHDFTGLVKRSLIDGAYELAPVRCGCVASWQGGLLAGDEAAGPRVHYADFEEALAGGGTALSWETWGGRITVRDDLLYVAWHSTNEIDVHSLPDGTHVRTIELEDYDTWVWGMAVTDDGLLVLKDYRSVSVFDVETGEALWQPEVSGMSNVSGLVCFTSR